MPGLLKFEWTRPKAPFSLERVEPLLLEINSAATGYVEYVRPDSGAPEWYKEALECHHYYPAPEREEDFLPLRGIRETAAYALDKITSGFYLVPKSHEIVSYQLFDDFPGAFMELAKTDQNIYGVASFISKYGKLHRRLEDSRTYTIDEYGIDYTITEIREINKAVEFWQPSNGGSPDYKCLDVAFQEYFRITEEEIGTPILSPSIEFKNGYPPSLSLVPHNLIAALWLQFAQAITLNTEIKKCVQCPTWFAYGAGTGRRKSADYCSDICRKAAHRQRKAKKHNG